MLTLLTPLLAKGGVYVILTVRVLEGLFEVGLLTDQMLKLVRILTLKFNMRLQTSPAMLASDAAIFYMKHL